MLDQRGNVFTSLTQWRKDERENVDAMEQVLAKFSFVNQRFQVAMCGHHHADVHGDRLVAADALDLAFFQHAQKLCLHGRGMSPISSRKIVPRSACSNLPI